jgi:hypothetical protein
VEFEIQKDGMAALAERLDDRVAGGEIELKANLEPGAGALESPGQLQGRSSGWKVESYDQFLLCGGVLRLSHASRSVARSMLAELWKYLAGWRQKGRNLKRGNICNHGLSGLIFRD